MEKLEERISLATRVLGLTLMIMVTAHVATSLMDGHLCYIGGNIGAAVSGNVDVEGAVSVPSELRVSGAVAANVVGGRIEASVGGDVNVSGKVAAAVKGDVGVTGDVAATVSGNVGTKVSGLVDVNGGVSARVSGLVDVSNGIGDFRIKNTDK